VGFEELVEVESVIDTLGISVDACTVPEVAAGLVT
jgi:hypothetical protein